MEDIPTQNEYHVTKQTTRIEKVIIYILNKNMQRIEEVSGNVVGIPTIRNDASTNLRRTCNISFIPTNSTFEISTGNKIWLDKFIQIEVGITDLRTDEMVYTKQGIFMINNPDRVYSESSNLISLEAIDLMGTMTGLRNGELVGLADYVIPQGTNVRTAIIGLITMAGFTKYICVECPTTVPNEIRLGTGATVWDYLQQLLNIYPDLYQMYFDVDGVFHYEEVPSSINEPVFVNDDIWKDVNVEYRITTPFDQVKNVVTVIGHAYDPDYYTENVVAHRDPEGQANYYTITIPEITSLTDGLMIAFEASEWLYSPDIQINSLPITTTYDKEGDEYFEIFENEYTVIQYNLSRNIFEVIGGIAPIFTATVLDNRSPFSEQNIGRWSITLKGGDFDNIYTTGQCRARAEWELYNRSRINDTVTITCAPVYWLDVNKVAEITLPNDTGVEETNKYLIKQITTSETQTITMMRYNSYYQ